MATSWVSRISGPIPAHPMYEKEPPSSTRARPVPRVRPEATHIADGHRGGVGLLLELQGRSALPSREPSAAKDHIRENVRRMREIQRASKAREEAQNKPVKPTWKNSKYEQVGSRALRSSSVPRPSSASGDYLRAHQNTGPPPDSDLAPLTPPRREPRPEKLTVPRAASAREVRMEHRERDFVRANARAASSARVRRTPSEESLARKRKDERYSNYRRGEVPDYLLKRQDQWSRSEQRRLASQPDPDQPPGHRKMAEAERRETLELLKTTERELLAELLALPIRMDTLRVRSRKEQIDRKLSEVEEAIKIFSKPKVFVRID